MILHRMGNKSRIAADIQRYFPYHKTYVEPFFGAGGMFFNKPKAKFNVLNDLDSDVFNLYKVVLDQKDELLTAFKQMPVHTALLDYWKDREEVDPIRRALRFLLLSNFTLYGAQDTIHLLTRSYVKKSFCDNLDLTFDILQDCLFSNFDFRKFLKSVSFVDYNYKQPSFDRDTTFIYADPPYLGSTNVYNVEWGEKDSNDLFDCLQETRCNWAMSEFEHPFILEQVEQRNLHIIELGERRNIKNRKVEILVTNYKKKYTF